MTLASSLRTSYNVFWSYSPSQLLQDPPSFTYTQLCAPTLKPIKSNVCSPCMSGRMSGLPLQCGWLTRGYILKENGPFLSQHPSLPIVPVQGWNTLLTASHHAYFFFPSGLSLHRSCVCCLTAVSSYVWMPCSVQKTPFPCSHPLPLAFTLPSLFWNTPEPQKRGLWPRGHLQGWVFLSLLLYVPWPELIIICYDKKLFWWGLRNTFVYGFKGNIRNQFNNISI